MKLETFELPPIGTNAYLLHNEEREEAILIDAPLNALPSVESYLVKTGAKLTAVLMTHGHWDHILDGHYFNEKTVPVYGHKADLPMFEQPSRMAQFAVPGLEMKPVEIDHWLEDGSSIELLGQTIEIRHVPGHCPGSLLFYFPHLAWAFSGDAIFAGSIGRTDFPGCSFDALERSIQNNIYTLPGKTRLFPGHGPDTTVEREATSNPYVQKLK